MKYAIRKSSRSLFRFHFKNSVSSVTSHQINTKKPFPEKSFFNLNKEGIVNRLCRDKRFQEAIDILCEQKRLREAIKILDQIVPPSASAYSSLIQFCRQLRALTEGKMIHEHFKTSGFEPGIVICNRLLDMYTKCDSLTDAQKLFDEMRVRDLCSWNTMISGYAKAGVLEAAKKLFDEMPERDSFSWTAMVSGYARHAQPEEALVLYRLMQRASNSKPNKFTISSALAASAAVPCIRSGKEIHGHIVRIGLDSDEVVWSALMDMYGKCGSIEEARNIFDKMAERDVVSWTAMIDRYFKDGRWREGFALFSNLIHSRVRPNEFTFAGVLNACADCATEELGKQVHGYMTRIGFDPYSFASSTLVHMYAKCGNIERAKNVFQGTINPHLVSWTSLIAGYAQNGQPNEALLYFELLLKSGTKPDHITFVGVLSACAHAGLVDKGLEYFHSIKERHGLTHTADHYACVVDLLARCGKFEEAMKIIDKMPMKPDKFLWASLLGGCRIHGNVELAERTAKELFMIEPENPATYVTMANIYATAGKWEEVAKLRSKMNDKRVVKKPGYSWTEIKRQVHVFTVGDTSHPRYSEINEFLSELRKKMKEEGYVPDVNFVLHDVEEEQKEQNLSYHSEKLAIAFAIISTPPETPIKVYKNLRTCVDCHTAIKFISRIAKRKIIVRDSNRFHCFQDGTCSCGDFW